MGRKALITGAAGGMGRACARLLGATQDLVLTDIQEASLIGFADELRRDGYSLASVRAGELLDADLVRSLAADVAGGPFTLVHAAGLSPALAGWRDIMAVNFVATEQLLDVLEARLTPGVAAIVISSAAGYRMPVDDAMKAALADPFAPSFMDQVALACERVAGDESDAWKGVSYALSKRAVHLTCRRRAVSWGPRGARILSVSPTLTHTNMGRQEIAATSGVGDFVSGAPLGRMASVMDIALAVRFLASDEASFITGCDLPVDGGSLAATIKE